MVPLYLDIFIGLGLRAWRHLQLQLPCARIVNTLYHNVWTWSMQCSNGNYAAVVNYYHLLIPVTNLHNGFHTIISMKWTYISTPGLFLRDGTWLNKKNSESTCGRSRTHVKRSLLQAWFNRSHLTIARLFQCNHIGGPLHHNSHVCLSPSYI